MKLLDSIKGAFGRVLRAFQGPPLMSIARGIVNSAEDVASPYKDSPWVYRGIRYKADNLGKLPLQIMTGQRGNDKLSRVVSNHPFQQVLERPNRFQNTYEFNHAWITILESEGACFIALPDRASPFVLPLEMYATNPNLWRRVKDKAGVHTAWEFRAGGKLERYELWEVMVLRYVDPDDPTGWLSPLRAARKGISASFKAEVYNEAFFRNSAIPRGFLSTNKPVSPNLARRYKAEWHDMHGGPTRAHSIALLEGGMKYESTAASHADMEWMAGQEWNRDLIFTVIGVWPEVFGYGNTTFANRAEAKRDVWESTLLPMISWVEMAWWHQLFSMVDGGRYWIEFDISKVPELQKDYTQRLDDGLKLWAVGVPMKTINERFSLQLEEYEGWDVGWMRVGVSPVSQILEEDGDDTVTEEDGDLEFFRLADQVDRISGYLPAPTIGQVWGKILKDAGYDAEELDIQSEAMAEEAKTAGTIMDALTSGSTAHPKASTGTTPCFASENRAPLRRTNYHKDLRKVEKKFKAKLTRYFRDMRGLVLRRMAALDGQKGIWVAARELVHVVSGGQILSDDDFFRAFTQSDADRLMLEIFETPALDKKLVKMLMPIYKESVKTGALQIISELGEDADASEDDWKPSPKMVKILEQRGKKITRINDTTRKRIASQLAKGLQAEENLQGLQTRVRNTFNATHARALMIARTETAGSMQDARWQEMREEQVDELEWDASMDDATRDDHMAEHGTVVKVGKRFPVTGLRYPCEAGGAAEQIINCRCTGNPIVR